jgi:hypothetical protein
VTFVAAGGFGTAVVDFRAAAVLGETAGMIAAVVLIAAAGLSIREAGLGALAAVV